MAVSVVEAEVEDAGVPVGALQEAEEAEDVVRG